MSLFENRRFLWPALILIAAAPRFLGAFFLPNTFGDAYVYIRDIGVLSTKLKTGTFALTDLYGFWLPLYQFISAVINLLIGNGFYSGKIVSALSGIGVCLLVFVITVRLTGRRIAALLSFLLITLDPLHILNSTSALTDVPHAFFVLASIHFILQKRWTFAATFAAFAGLTRVESWMFLALLPLIQISRERRVSIVPILILVIPPLFWFYVSWKATGDWLACFRARQQYHDWLLIQNPSLAKFSFAGVTKDIAMFVSGADAAVLIAAFIAGWFLIRKFVRRSQSNEISSKTPSPNEASVLSLLIVFFAFFALLLVAYVTHQQPIIFPRYGLILFSLGIPILAWTYFAISCYRPAWSRRILTAIVVLCALNWSAQFVGAVGELNRYSAQRQVADYLREHFDVNSNFKIFCDEDAVKVLSGIPEDKFLSSANVPSASDNFPAFLKQSGIEYLVYVKKRGSIPVRELPDAESKEPAGFNLVTHSYSDFFLTDIRLFRANAH